MNGHRASTMYTWILALVCIGVGVESVELSSSVTVSPGSPVTLKCSATGIETGVILTSPIGTVYRSQDTNQRYVVIQLAAAGDNEAGKWTCRSTSGSSSATTTVTLLQRVSARVSHTGPISVGGVAVFKCELRGNPLPAATWYKGSTQINRQFGKYAISEVVKSFAKFSTLQVQNVQESDGGSYSCRAASGGNSAGGSAYLSVSSIPTQKPRPTRATTTRRSVAIPTQKPRPTRATTTRRSGFSTSVSSKMSYKGPSELGEELRLDCKVTGPAGKTITWSKNYRRINFSPRVQTLTSSQADGEHSILVIKNAVSSDTGRYTCYVRSGFSSSRSSVGVSFRNSGGIVADPTAAPIPTTRQRFFFRDRLSARLSPSSYVPRVGSKLTLDCKVTTTTGATVTLTKDHVAVELSRETREDGEHYTYTINSAKKSDSGTYRCEVRGQSGSVARSERRVFVIESPESSSGGTATSAGSVGHLGFLVGLFTWWTRL